MTAGSPTNIHTTKKERFSEVPSVKWNKVQERGDGRQYRCLSFSGFTVEGAIFIYVKLSESWTTGFWLQAADKTIADFRAYAT